MIVVQVFVSAPLQIYIEEEMFTLGYREAVTSWFQQQQHNADSRQRTKPFLSTQACQHHQQVMHNNCHNSCADCCIWQNCLNPPQHLQHPQQVNNFKQHPSKIWISMFKLQQSKKPAFKGQPPLPFYKRLMFPPFLVWHQLSFQILFKRKHLNFKWVSKNWSSYSSYSHIVFFSSMELRINNVLFFFLISETFIGLGWKVGTSKKSIYPMIYLLCIAKSCQIDRTEKNR